MVCCLGSCEGNYTSTVFSPEQPHCGSLIDPQGRPPPTPGTHECVSFHGKREFAGVMKLRVLRWGLFWIILCIQCNHKAPCKKRAGESEEAGEKWGGGGEAGRGRCYAAGFEDRGRGHAKDLGGHQKLETKQRNRICLRAFREE